MPIARPLPKIGARRPDRSTDPDLLTPPGATRPGSVRSFVRAYWQSRGSGASPGCAREDAPAAAADGSVSVAFLGFRLVPPLRAHTADWSRGSIGSSSGHVRLISRLITR